jgi:class 3 adenylate cyclase/CheY-like chemotaxis protein
MHGGQAQGAGPITRRTGLAPAPPVEPAVKRTTYLPPPAAPEAPAPGSTRASYLPQPLAAPRPQTLAVRAAGPAAPAPLAGDTAHELYTPINQILGYARLLMGALRGRVPAQHVEDLLNIERAARTLLGIAEALETGETAEGVPPSSTRISADDMYDATDPMGPAAPVGSLGTLLVVDDSRMNRDVLCRVLGRAGYFTEVAEDGPRALALAARQRFDAVLLDVNMPGMSGLGVLAALRASQTSAELPVIMVTTQGASEDVVEALKLGANDHVIKPIDFDVLLARLDTHLTLKRSRQELAELAAEVSLKNEFIRKTFGRYLSEDVVHRLLTTPEGQRLGGEEREVTILMSDVRSFTTMTEHMPPELVMDLLNGYLGEMARLVAARGGTIIEFIGDAVLAVFGAPFGAGDDARRAVTCALEMQLAMDGVNERNARSGLPQLEIGVALNTGVVVVGNIGGEARTKYGVVGAHVNLTARIEAFSVGRQILISESTRRAAGPGLLIGQSHALAVKGFQDRVLAFELVGLDGPTRVSLPERRAELALLARPLAVECVRLVGKRTDGEPSRGLVIALSPSGAALRLRPRPAPFTNLLLRLPGALGEQLGGELYAKVIELDARVEDTLRVRFTSAPPGLAALVQALREA